MTEEKFEDPACFKVPSKLAAFGDEKHLDMLFQAPGGDKLLSVKDEYGCDSLTWAARNGRINVVNMLLKKDADVASKSYKCVHSVWPHAPYFC